MISRTLLFFICALMAMLTSVITPAQFRAIPIVLAGGYLVLTVCAFVESRTTGVNKVS